MTEGSEYCDVDRECLAWWRYAETLPHRQCLFRGGPRKTWRGPLVIGDARPIPNACLALAFGKRRSQSPNGLPGELYS